jgi:hypothetical protein
MLTLTAQEMPELVRRRTADRHRDQPITQHLGPLLERTPSELHRLEQLPDSLE